MDTFILARFDSYRLLWVMIFLILTYPPAICHLLFQIFRLLCFCRRLLVIRTRFMYHLRRPRPLYL